MAERIELADLSISYTDAGKGPPLILLHGGLATAAMSWNTAMPMLAPHFRVIAPDSRGHGETNNPSNHLAYDQMADDVVAFAKAIGAEKPLVFGYSDGGQIGLEIALRHPGFAQAYVFGGTISQRTEDYLDGIRGWGFPAPGDADFERISEVFGGFFTQIKQVHKGNGEKDYWRKMLPQISRLWLELPDYSLAQLATIAEPALVIMGDRDHLSGDDQPRRLFKALPKGELAIIPNADHSASETEVFWQVVLDFLKRHAGDDAGS